MAKQEAEDILIPVHLWIRKHYTKLPRNNRTRCNYCNAKFTLQNRSLANLHEHLMKTHLDKLSEEEKKEDKFHWTWNYFIAESDTKATCTKCDITITYYSVTDLKMHLKRIHKIFDPNSDVESNNESNSDNDMIANEDITKKTDNFIPVHLWIREHYTKLPRNNTTRCNYCNAKFTLQNRSLANLHEHLMKTHLEKLSEEEKKEDKFHWTWNYFIAESDTKATCTKCDITITYYSVTDLKMHLKLIHKIFDPNSDRVESSNESNSVNDMIANEDITKKAYNFIPVRLCIRKHYTKLPKNNAARCNYCNATFIIQNRSLAKLHVHLVKRHPDILSEEEKKEDKFHWIWDYFIAESDTKATCKKCDLTFKYRKVSDLKSHLKRIHKIFDPNSDRVESNSDNDTNANENTTKKTDNFIPVRFWIREHYTKLTKYNMARCNYCKAKFSIHNWSLANLHKHLVKRHPDILSEEEKKEDKFHWIWDYFIAKSDTEATCKNCDLTFKYHTVTDLKSHLKRIHKILGPNSNRVDNENSSNNEMTINEDIISKTDNFIPVRRWIRGHYIKLTSSNGIKCNHCNATFIIQNKSLAYLHKHLKRHPNILSEEEKKEDKFHWTWDYFIAKSNTEATCKKCDLTIKYHRVYDLNSHLKRIHKILGPNSNRVDNESNPDNDMSVNEDI